MSGEDLPYITGNNVAYGYKPTVTGPDRTVRKCSSLASRGFVSPGVMVGFALIVEGMSVTPRPVLWSGIELELEGLSWSGAVCPHHRTELVVIAGNLNAVRYREDVLLPHVVPFLQNVSVLSRPAKSPDLNPIEHFWPFPPEVSGNLQVPWWKRGVTSHSKNWQIWCSP